MPGGRTITYTYNTSRIKADTFDYVYTRNAGGNVTAIGNYQVPNVATGQSCYSYNPANNQLTAITGLNRIIQVENQGSVIATYGYDSNNRRIRKTAGTTTTHYLYDLSSQLIAEILVDGTKLRNYIYLDGEPIAVKEYQTTPGTYYFINDHLGTPQRLVTASGTVVWQAAYLPFGKAQVTVETVKNNLRFPGQYYDSETGLHYNWHRFYDPETGRYISADPIGLAGGMNLYAYVQNDPVNLIDPWGLDSGYLYGEPGSLGSEWPAIPKPKPPWYKDPNHGLAQSFDPANPKPIRGPFGTLCGAEGTATATWVPDLLPGACKRHDDCYDKCARNCEGYDCKTKCDYKLMGGSIIYGGATYFGGKDAYDSAKEKYGCPCE